MKYLIILLLTDAVALCFFCVEKDFYRFDIAHIIIDLFEATFKIYFKPMVPDGFFVRAINYYDFY